MVRHDKDDVVTYSRNDVFRSDKNYSQAVLARENMSAGKMSTTSNSAFATTAFHDMHDTRVRSRAARHDRGYAPSLFVDELA